MDEQVEKSDMAGGNPGNPLFWLRLGLLDRCVLCPGRSTFSGGSTLGKPVPLGMISARWWEIEKELFSYVCGKNKRVWMLRGTVTYAFKIHCGVMVT